MAGVVQGHFGELLQGRIGPKGPVALITLPCPPFTATVTATVSATSAPGFSLSDAAGVLGPERAIRMLTELGLPGNVAYRLTLTMPPGGGAGASSAALMALALAAGARDPALITAAALTVEGATDPLLAQVPERLLWASRQGRVLAEMPVLPRFEVLGGFLGPGQRTDPSDDDFPDIADLVSAWPRACEVLKDMADLVSESARRTLARRGPSDDPTEALALRLGAFGHVIAHTGSARGLIFAPGMVPEAAEAGLREAGFSRITRFGCGG
jgi:uncharacterized protein involved in propanediol utilization